VSEFIALHNLSFWQKLHYFVGFSIDIFHKALHTLDKVKLQIH